MQLLKRIKWVYMLLSLFLIGLGVCLFVWPDIPSVTICCAVGAGAVLFGIVKIVLYFLRELEAMTEQYDFAIGAMCVIAGAVLLVHPAAVLALIPQVLGFYMLIDCVFKLQIALDAKRLGNKGWWMSLVVTLVCILWGCLLVWQPFGLEKHLTFLIAGGIIADGVQNLLGVIYIAATVKKTEADGKEILEPAEILLPPEPTEAPAPKSDTPPVKPAPAAAEPAAETDPVPQAPPAAPAVPAPRTEKKSLGFFRKRQADAPVSTEPPLTPPDFSHLAAQEQEDADGAVAEIKFNMHDEGDKNP